MSPHHLWGGVIYYDNPPLGGSGVVNLLFILNDGDTPPSNGDSGASVTLDIIVYTILCVNSPMDNI